MQCSTCGEQATHLWGALDVQFLLVTSINGRGYLSPSCDACGGPASLAGGHFATVRIPLVNGAPEIEVEPLNACETCGALPGRDCRLPVTRNCLHPKVTR